MLDEPTTGLHFDDIAKLLGSFERLIANGGSLVVIEHNLDVIRAADWVIDLGPEGGSRGGRGLPALCVGHPRRDPAGVDQSGGLAAGARLGLCVQAVK